MKHSTFIFNLSAFFNFIFHNMFFFLPYSLFFRLFLVILPSVCRILKMTAKYYLCPN